MIQLRVFFLIEFIQRVKYKLSLDRKSDVLRYIKKYKPQNILEIGVFNGEFALRMLKTAKKVSPNGKITYYGIDLFEKITVEQLVIEVSPIAVRYDSIKKKLDSLDCDVNLLKGHSSFVLPKLIGNIEFDLIVIDGGHSEATVSKDWFYSSKLMTRSGAVFFDDYTNKNGEINGYGINKVVDQISHASYTISISRNYDLFWKPYGVLQTRMVKIQNK